MERAAWTDQRLDDRFEHIDKRFDQVDARFDRVDADIRDVRTAIGSLQATLTRVGGGIMVGLVGVIGAILARGV